MYQEILTKKHQNATWSKSSWLSSNVLKLNTCSPRIVPFKSNSDAILYRPSLSSVFKRTFIEQLEAQNKPERITKVHCMHNLNDKLSRIASKKFIAKLNLQYDPERIKIHKKYLRQVHVHYPI